jgi:RNA polymerase sporulation-specific sigma factor
MANTGLVYYLVLKNNNNIPDDDLAQEGFIALIKATERFDPDKGTLFATFAASYIDGYIKTYKNLNRVIRPCRISNSGKYRYASVASLNAPIDEYGMAEYGDILADDYRFEETVLDKTAFDGFLPNLQERDRQIFLLSLKGKTQKHIADCVGLSQSYVSRKMKTLAKKYTLHAGIRRTL